MPTKILAIDDSKTMRLAIKITFAAEDAEVVAVSKGSEAVGRAKQMGADVVLVDHRLAAGEPSGWEVCQALKADPATAQIPVLVMVARAPSPQDEAKAAECGAAGLIAKPFASQELIDKVQTAVAGAGASARPAAKPGGAPRPVPGKPPVRAPAAAPAAAPRPAAKPAAPPRPAAGPVASPRPAAKPTSAPRPAAKPAAAPRPAAKPAAAPRPAAKPPVRAPAAAAGAPIPIAVPIPFAPASAPTSKMLERLQQGGAAAGLDPKVAAALVQLSREVIEQVVWEVVPDLAEAIIKEQQAQSA